MTDPTPPNTTGIPAPGRRRAGRGPVLRWAVVAALVASGLTVAAPTAGAGSVPAPTVAAAVAPPPVIPQPTTETVLAGPGFTVTSTTKIGHAGSDPATAAVAGYLASLLRPATGYPLPVSSGATAGGITLDSSGPAALGDEGYTLEVRDTGVILVAHTAQGLFRGVQTLRQLLPTAVESKTVVAGPWVVPAVSIADQPRFAYRSTMLDVGRRFYSVADIKRYIDQVALYKINTLHLHLTDDQGWRIAIDAYPALTTIGASTQSGFAAGSNTSGSPWFYTKAEYLDLVNYAGSRFITVVPEVDGPGHTSSALASVPNLNCNDKAVAPYSGFDVGISSYCLTDATHIANVTTFLTTVINELAAMTPGPYIHLGGDETPSTTLAAYRAYVNAASTATVNAGKKVMGWHDLAQGDLPAGSVMQYWGEGSDSATIGTANESASIRNVRSGLTQGAKLVMSPADRSYLDMKYTSSTPYGLSWAGLVSVQRAYSWDPATLLSNTAGTTTLTSESDILGVEASLWADRAYSGSTSLPTSTDQFPPPAKYTDYMAFPRLPAIAEIGWSPKATNNWDDFKVRLAAQAPRWEQMGIGYFPAAGVPWPAQPPAPVKAVHYWPLDETSGSTVADVISGSTGTLTSGSTPVAAKVGGGINLDGVASGISTTAATLQAPWTVGLWVKRTGETSSAALFGGAQAAIKLEQYKNTHQVGVTVSGVADDKVSYTAPLNEWVYLTFAADTGSTSIYADGAKVGTIPRSAALPLGWIGKLPTGPNSGANDDRAKAVIDDIVVYNGTLSDAEASSLAAAATSTRAAAGASVVLSTDQQGPAAAGDVVHLTATVTATGLVDLSNLALSSASAGPASACSTTVLQVAKTWVCNWDHTVTAAEADHPSLEVTATLTAAGSNPLATAVTQASNTLQVPIASVPDPQFTDVPAGSKFFAEITWLAAQGVTTGYPDGTFRPTQVVERQALAAFLYRIEHGSTPAPACTTKPYPDVAVGSPFCGAITWLKSQHIASGWPDGTFRPTAAIERQAMAAFLLRWDGATAPACTTRPFSDVSVGSSFCSAINWLKTEHVTSGFDDGSFHPGASIDRQAMAAFLYRLQHRG